MAAAGPRTGRGGEARHFARGGHCGTPTLLLRSAAVARTSDGSDRGLAVFLEGTGINDCEATLDNPQGLQAVGGWRRGRARTGGHWERLPMVTPFHSRAIAPFRLPNAGPRT